MVFVILLLIFSCTPARASMCRMNVYGGMTKVTKVTITVSQCYLVAYWRDLAELRSNMTES